MSTTPGKRLVQAAQEAVAIAKGEQPAARITINGHSYVPEAEYRTLLESNAALERERDEARRQSDRFCDKYLAALSRAEAAEAERDRLKKRVAELEKALEPFAREAEDWSPEANGGHVFDDAESIAGETSITVGHLRTARAYRDKGRW